MLADSEKAAKGYSISVIAAGDRDRDNALQKLQGMKASNGSIIVLWDEAQDCSADVFRAATNLANNPKFEMKCTGNAAHRKPGHPLDLANAEPVLRCNGDGSQNALLGFS